MDPQPPTCEFGLELIAILPALHARAVDRTCSLPGTAPWYHWSPHHTEVPGSRSYTMLHGDWPMTSLHTCSRLPPSIEAWSPPPMVTPARITRARALWADFIGDVHTAPLLVHNKICDEWGKGPIHNIPDPVLSSIAQSTHAAGRRLLYIRPDGGERGYTRDANLIDPSATSDYRTVEDNGGFTLQRFMDHAGVDYNEGQILLSTITQDFVSVQGGAAIVASYFGGNNLIYAKKGVEITRRLYEPDSLLAALAGTTLTVTDSAWQLPDLLRRHILA